MIWQTLGYLALFYVLAQALQHMTGWSADFSIAAMLAAWATAIALLVATSG